MRTKADIIAESDLKLPDPDNDDKLVVVAYITEEAGVPTVNFDVPDGFTIDRARALKVRDWLTEWLDTPVGESDERRAKRLATKADLQLAYAHYMANPSVTAREKDFASHLVAYVETLEPEARS